MTVRSLPVSPRPGRVHRRRRPSGRSDSVRGAPSSRVSLVKIANIDLSRGSQPSKSVSILSRTCCWPAGKLTTPHCPEKTEGNGSIPSVRPIPAARYNPGHHSRATR
jgi:hypothetical protein